MVKKGNVRVIATLTPKAQINLSYLEEKTNISKSVLIQLAINYYADLIRKEKV